MINKVVPESVFQTHTHSIVTFDSTSLTERQPVKTLIKVVLELVLHFFLFHCVCCFLRV